MFWPYAGYSSKSLRYVDGCRHRCLVILDEFVAATGYERQYAIRLLNGPVPTPRGPTSARAALWRRRAAGVDGGLAGSQRRFAVAPLVSIAPR